MIHEAVVPIEQLSSISSTSSCPVLDSWTGSEEGERDAESLSGPIWKIDVEDLSFLGNLWSFPSGGEG